MSNDLPPKGDLSSGFSKSSLTEVSCEWYVIVSENSVSSSVPLELFLVFLDFFAVGECVHVSWWWAKIDRQVSEILIFVRQKFPTYQPERAHHNLTYKSLPGYWRWIKLLLAITRRLCCFRRQSNQGSSWYLCDRREACGIDFTWGWWRTRSVWLKHKFWLWQGSGDGGACRQIRAISEMHVFVSSCMQLSRI